ncbi:MAG TPA: winged helix DNA-binding domain-containing protein [Caldilineaceae bacterium]|nr:winged helix DNA-binding domain-containing protein [Caldilineaceae bacterium]
MTPEYIAQARLASQQVASSQCSQPGEVVSRLGAVQSQDYASSLWAVGVRLPGATEAAVERAIAERRILRTWPMRGTIHMVAAEDAGWMLALLTPRVLAASARRRQQLDLDDATLARSEALLVKALEGGQQLPRDEVYRLLEAAGISTAGQRGYHILWQLAQRGLVCFGPHQGKQPTFVLLDEWAPHQRRLARDEALAELAQRYFTGHGPATLQDFVWWSGLTMGDARAGLESVASQLTKVEANGQVYWMSQATPATIEPAPRAYLLPAFDEYLLGYRERSAVLDPRHAQQVAPGSNGVFRPLIVIGGRVVGTWQRAHKKNAVVVTASPFMTLSQDEQQALAAAAEPYGRFLGKSVVLS